jgi:hydroxymethylbilane synthase
MDFSLVAVLERASASDVLVQTHKADLQQSIPPLPRAALDAKHNGCTAIPTTTVVNLRGNVQTRMDKLFSSNWEGAIFAKAGLERVELLGSHFQELKWMIPAPAQGAIGVVCRAEDTELIELLKKINHQPTRECVDIERDFLRILEGGCSAPIGAHAVVAQDKIQFKGGIFSLDGQIAATTLKEVQMADGKNLAAQAAEDVLSKGGHQVMRTIKYNKE